MVEPPDGQTSTTALTASPRDLAAQPPARPTPRTTPLWPRVEPRRPIQGRLSYRGGGPIRPPPGDRGPIGCTQRSCPKGAADPPCQRAVVVPAWSSELSDHPGSSRGSPEPAGKFHDLRHTCATLLIASRERPIELSRRRLRNEPSAGERCGGEYHTRGL